MAHPGFYLRFFTIRDPTMELFAAVQTRSSAARLAEPGPTPEDLEHLLQAAARAPDHGRLKPWRLVVLQGATRDAFTVAAAEAKRARLPAMTAEQLAAEREKISRSPAIVVIGCAVNREQSKIPEIEQIVAVGAAAQNLFLAAHDLGYGVMWKTGAAAYDPAVKATVGLRPNDHIVAIMHLGARVK
jgi:nitroreductase